MLCEPSQLLLPNFLLRVSGYILRKEEMCYVVTLSASYSCMLGVSLTPIMKCMSKPIFFRTYLFCAIVHLRIFQIPTQHLGLRARFGNGDRL